ncbi:hypothetical protein [Qipengyuania nanhaisediminis]|uniref:hypothetical protein n=1 Tax=Qipengyuania nanhaisediminis TaxID=604088 RepID=UPI0038B24E4F
MILVVIAKSVAIAAVAALAAWLPMAILFASGTDGSSGATFAVQLLPVALLGSFAIGLPVALLVLFLASDTLIRKIGAVLMAANLARVMMILVTSLLWGQFGALFYGVPSWIAANVFALLGWLWILKPMREAQYG